MGRKPRGEKAMTNAERQKRLRDRRKPKTRSQEFRAKLYQLVTTYEHYLDVDEIDATLEQLQIAYGMNLYRLRTGQDANYLCRWYNDEQLVGVTIADITKRNKAKAEEYKAEAEEMRSTPPRPADPAEAGEIIHKLVQALS